MFSKVLMGVIAGSVVSATAFAGDDATLPVTDVKMVPMEAYTGALRPKLTRAVGLIFDNSDTSANLITNTANQAWVIDDHSLNPGNASALRPQLITGIAIGFAVRGLATDTRSFDVVIEFFDRFNSAAAANTNAWNTSLGSFRVGFSNLAGNSAYTTAMIDLTGLSGGGIQTTDDGFGISMRFVEPGTDTLVNTSPIPVTHLFQSAIDGAATGTQSNLLLNGHNGLGSWRDVDNDTFVETTERTTFAWPINARFWLQLEGDARCPADYNNDGFVDGIDSDQFNNDFEAGC
jgi:hypothetical protein